MATFAILAAALAAAPLFDGPISTRPVVPQAAPLATPPVAAAPSPAAMPGRTPPPDDDYGYVAFCYGAETVFLDLYDRVMPEVERIERAFPGTTSVEEALADYRLLRAESRANIEAYAGAMRGAERAAATPIAAQGVAAIRLGRQSWSIVTSQDLPNQARAWMGWAPSQDCATRAKALAVPATAPSGPGALMASAVDLDRQANPPVGIATASAPQLRPAQTAPFITPPPVQLAATPAPPALPAATGLGVSFSDEPPPPGVPPTALLPATAAMPTLITTPTAAASPEPLPWRGAP